MGNLLLKNYIIVHLIDSLEDIKTEIIYYFFRILLLHIPISTIWKIDNIAPKITMLVKLSIKCWLKLIPSCVTILLMTLDIERLYHLFNINLKLLISFLITVIKLEISFALVWKPFCTSPLLGSGFSTSIRCIWVIARQIISVIRGNWLSLFPRFPLAFHRACPLDSTDVIITTWTFISRWNLCGKITSSRATMRIY